MPARGAGDPIEAPHVLDLLLVQQPHGHRSFAAPTRPEARWGHSDGMPAATSAPQDRLLTLHVNDVVRMARQERRSQFLGMIAAVRSNPLQSNFGTGRRGSAEHGLEALLAPTVTAGTLVLHRVVALSNGDGERPGLMAASAQAGRNPAQRADGEARRAWERAQQRRSGAASERSSTSSRDTRFAAELQGAGCSRLPSTAVRRMSAAERGVPGIGLPLNDAGSFPVT